MSATTFVSRKILRCVTDDAGPVNAVKSMFRPSNNNDLRATSAMRGPRSGGRGSLVIVRTQQGVNNVPLPFVLQRICTSDIGPLSRTITSQGSADPGSLAFSAYDQHGSPVCAASEHCFSTDNYSQVLLQDTRSLKPYTSTVPHEPVSPIPAFPVSTATDFITPQEESSSGVIDHRVSSRSSVVIEVERERCGLTHPEVDVCQFFREPVRSTFFSTLHMLLNAVIGVGVLTLPHAFACMGYSALLMCVGLTVLYCHTGELIVHSLKLAEPLAEKLGVPKEKRDWRWLGYASFGVWGERLCDIVATSEIFFAMVTYLLMAGSVFDELFNYCVAYLGNWSSKISTEAAQQHSVGLVVGSLMTLCLMSSSADALVRISRLANYAALTLILFLSVSVAQSMMLGQAAGDRKLGLLNVQGVLTAFGLMNFCFVAHAIFPNIFQTSFLLAEQEYNLRRSTMASSHISPPNSCVVACMLTPQQPTYNSKLSENPLITPPDTTTTAELWRRSSPLRVKSHVVTGVAIGSYQYVPQPPPPPAKLRNASIVQWSTSVGSGLVARQRSASISHHKGGDCESHSIRVAHPSSWFVGFFAVSLRVAYAAAFLTYGGTGLIGYMGYGQNAAAVFTFNIGSDASGNALPWWGPRREVACLAQLAVLFKLLLQLPLLAFYLVDRLCPQYSSSSPKVPEEQATTDSIQRVLHAESSLYNPLILNGSSGCVNQSVRVDQFARIWRSCADLFRCVSRSRYISLANPWVSNTILTAIIAITARLVSGDRISAVAAFAGQVFALASCLTLPVSCYLKLSGTQSKDSIFKRGVLLVLLAVGICVHMIGAKNFLKVILSHHWL